MGSWVMRSEPIRSLQLRMAEACKSTAFQQRKGGRNGSVGSFLVSMILHVFAAAVSSCPPARFQARSKMKGTTLQPCPATRYLRVSFGPWGDTCHHMSATWNSSFSPAQAGKQGRQTMDPLQGNILAGERQFSILTL